MPILVVLLLQLAPDTLSLRADEALERAAAQAPAAVAAELRVDAARARVRAAGAWADPTITAAAENVGATRTAPDLDGMSGLEGQVVVGLPLPIGGDRSAAVAEARARADVAAAERRIADADVRAATIVAIATVERDATIARGAALEASALRTLAAALERRVVEGHAAGGDAARAALEASLAATEAARREAALVESRERLARLLGVNPGTVVVVDAPSCVVPAEPAGTRSGAPELALAEARAAAADAAARMAAARARPDLVPQIGVRRAAGLTGLYLGIGTELPVFGATRSRHRASRFEADASEADHAGVAAQLAAERRAAEAELRLLDEAGRRFDDAWRSALARAVRAAEARHEAGEGTLAEVLDARRARRAALVDFATWRAERRTARARVARLTGAPLDADLLCDDIPSPE